MLHELFTGTMPGLLAGAWLLIGALWLDKWLGEPRRFHPLAGFGNLVQRIEAFCRGMPGLSEKQQGVLGWLLAVVPVVLITVFLVALAWRLSPVVWFGLNAVILYVTIGGRSLIEHAEYIYQPLQAGEIERAREQVSMIVSRNTENMQEKDMVSAAIESVLENGNDAVFAPVIWFLIAGAPGAVLFRLVNTLDAMWGYKNEKYLHFGFFSAKIDDFLAWLPARITALIYAFQGSFSHAMDCWRTQAKACSSPNGGVVMTTGAGALNVTIGGPAYYHGVLHEKQPMGVGPYATAEAIPRANRLVERGSFALSYLWLACVLAGLF
ncbi:cobalamin biosynthesis protein [Vibrio aerogenes CECT 7868]|uniref:Cobalamin biosynthesis protein CobD n=1 Tax=Vibrio aerogenes CECT 7868 TaxID=1216006 RepID=A0A1M6ABP9_9VIBR|nr:adenosylcobinamide-phosphate synthase CbiB [Vibrio aerogenes]SHI33885.1 cobalamin biosynthesis protein [Vibrio aerogenes CECT 7868]